MNVNCETRLNLDLIVKKFISIINRRNNQEKYMLRYYY